MWLQNKISCDERSYFLTLALYIYIYIVKQEVRRYFGSKALRKNYKNCKEIRCSFLVSPAESMILWGILKILIGGFREGRYEAFGKADRKQKEKDGKKRVEKGSQQRAWENL